MLIHVFEVKIKALTPFKIPYFPGSMLRGAFGVALKRTVCVNPEGNCSGCAVKDDCIYRFLFEPESNTPRIKNPPHPFITYPLSLGGKSMRRGSVYTFGFTVFGNAIGKLPYVVYSITQMGRLGVGKGKGRFEVKEIKKYISPKRRITIYSQKDGKLKEAPGLDVGSILSLRPVSDSLILEAITPIRMKLKGKLTHKIGLRDILLSIVRRFSTLSTLYGGGERDVFKDFDVDRVLDGVKDRPDFRWVDFKRFSKRQDAYMMMGGAMGRMIVEGKFESVYPILKVGELIHIGKNTSFGLGRYRVVE